MRSYYIKGVTTNEWTRNPLWPQIPTTNDRAYIVWGVFEYETLNECSITTVAGQNIYWGDGSSTLNGSSTGTHSYDYSAITAPIITHPSGRNYKPVLIEIDRNGNPPLEFFYNQEVYFLIIHLKLKIEWRVQLEIIN